MRNTMLAMALTTGFCGVAAAEEAGEVHGKSYVETKTDQVMAAFLMFSTVYEFEQQQNAVQQVRERDALLLPGGVPSMRSVALGAAVMGAAVALAAHAPEALRPIVDGKVHVGPALFEDGGMGAGLGGRF